MTVALGNGFILTAMLWGGFLAELIDRHLRKASAYLVILGLLTCFGIIHSALPDGAMYLPWHLAGLARQVPVQFTLGYGVLACVFLGLSFTREARGTVNI